MKLRSVVAMLSALSLLTLMAPRQAFAHTPPAPALISPAAGAGLATPLTISWSAVTDPSGILGYNWQVSTSSSFSTIALQNSTNGNVTQDTVSGLSAGTYFWRVQAVSVAFVQGPWSAPRSLTITGAGSGQPSAPTMSPTKAYSTFHPLEVMVFNWSAVPTASSYVLQVAKDPSFPVTTTFQINNVQNPTYAYSTPDEGVYYARAYAVNSSGVAGIPSNTISFSVFYNNPIGAAPAPISPVNGGTLSLPINLNWTNVANPQPSGYELQIAKDPGFASIEDFDPQLNDPSHTVLSLTSGQKFWRVRSHQGDASPTTAAVTAWSSTGTFTVSANSTPVSMAFTLSPVFSGDTTFLQLQLTSAAPAAGSVINLSSSDPNAFPVPATVTMPGNLAWTQFQVQAGQVTLATPVTITASLNAGSATAQVSVLPPSLKSVTLSPATISGGATASGIVALNGQAPSGGAVVSLVGNSAAALVPAAVTVAPGNFTASFNIPTNNVAVNTLATVIASWNGNSAQSQFTIAPQGQPASISVGPAAVTPPIASFGTVTIAAPSTVDQTFQISSSNPAAASVGGSVTVPAGVTAGGFNITTFPVTTQTTVTISVTGGGVTRTAALTLNPSAPPSQGVSLAVTAGGRSGERVVSSPAGISVATGSTGSTTFLPGTSITLSVASGRDAIWSGACSSNNAKAKSCTFVLNANSSVAANVQ